MCFLQHGMSLWGYKQRSELVSTRNCSLLILFVMKRRPVAVMQTCATTDVCCYFILPAVSAGLSTLLCRGSVAAMVPTEGGCSIISVGWVCDLISVFWSWSKCPLSSVLNDATLQERSSICCRSAALLGSEVMLTSVGWGLASIMQSTQGLWIPSHLQVGR